MTIKQTPKCKVNQLRKPRTMQGSTIVKIKQTLKCNVSHPPSSQSKRWSQDNKCKVTRSCKSSKLRIKVNLRFTQMQRNRIKYMIIDFRSSKRLLQSIVPDQKDFLGKTPEQSSSERGHRQSASCRPKERGPPKCMYTITLVFCKRVPEQEANKVYVRFHASLMQASIRTKESSWAEIPEHWRTSTWGSSIHRSLWCRRLGRRCGATNRRD